MPVVDAIATAPRAIWHVDADDYSGSTCNLILAVSESLRGAFRDGATDTLVTRTMLGVFGCVPAFDARFVQGSGLRTFNRKSLGEIGRFYQQNSGAIERHRVRTLDFKTGRPTDHRYGRAKVIDMILFIEGGAK
jgi:hypothetical protein